MERLLDCKLERMLNPTEKDVIIREAFIEGVHISRIKRIGVSTENDCSKCLYGYKINGVDYCLEQDTILDYLKGRFQLKLDL